MNSRSQIGQDRFVQDVLKNKKNGYFVDIGCGNPELFNNTFVLEKDLDWQGVAIDIEIDKNEWSRLRPKTKTYEIDALVLDYKSVFQKNNLPQNIDYLSIDLEPPRLTLECLKKIPFDTYTFNVITFEVDKYRSSNVLFSRPYFLEHGYVHISEHGVKENGILKVMDDFYIHHTLADAYIETIKGSWIFDGWAHNKLINQ